MRRGLKADVRRAFAEAKAMTGSYHPSKIEPARRRFAKVEREVLAILTGSESPDAFVEAFAAAMEESAKSRTQAAESASPPFNVRHAALSEAYNECAQALRNEWSTWKRTGRLAE